MCLRGIAHYDITVNGKIYRTIRVLNDFRAASIIGRATRVWEVYCPNDAQDVDELKVYALKDVWIGVNALTEKQIQDDIFHNINKVNQIENLSSKPEDYKKFFMTLDACEVVRTPSGEEYSSKEYLHQQEFPKFWATYSLRPVSENGPHMKKDDGTRNGTRPSGSTSMSNFGSSHSLPPNRSSGFGHTLQAALSQKTYHSKKQCRVVFHEVGIPLSELMHTNQKQFFESCADVMKGLSTSGVFSSTNY